MKICESTAVNAPRILMSSALYRAKAEQMDAKARDPMYNEAFVVEFQNMAAAWRKLAELADWQETMARKGHLKV